MAFKQGIGYRSPVPQSASPPICLWKTDTAHVDRTHNNGSAPGNTATSDPAGLNGVGFGPDSRSAHGGRILLKDANRCPAALCTVVEAGKPVDRKGERGA